MGEGGWGGGGEGVSASLKDIERKIKIQYCTSKDQSLNGKLKSKGRAKTNH